MLHINILSLYLIFVFVSLLQVWYQNRRAREKRRKEKPQRLVQPNIPKTQVTTPTTSASNKPVAMTTIKMHWHDDPTSTDSSVSPHVYHPYQNQWNTPVMQDQRNWYYANAYQPVEPSYPSNTTLPPGGMSSSYFSTDLPPNGMTYPSPQIPAHFEQSSLPPVAVSVPQPTSLRPVALSLSVTQPTPSPPTATDVHIKQERRENSEDTHTHPLSHAVMNLL